MSDAAKRTRARVRALIFPDLTQLRMALGLSQAEAAEVLKEHRSLVASQEYAGLDADKQYVQESAAKYIAYAAELAESKRTPPALIKGVATMYRFRRGLGLNLNDAAKILRLRVAVLQDAEDSRRALPDDMRIKFWATYADWAARSLQRHEREVSVRPPLLLSVTLVPSRPTDEAAEVGKLAYPKSRAQIEADVFRMLS